MEKLVAETGGAPEPEPEPQKDRPRTGSRRGDKFAARAAEAKKRKAASLAGQATMASRLLTLRTQARKNIQLRNTKLAKQAPMEASSESDEEHERLDPDEPEKVADVDGGDSIRTVSSPATTSPNV